MRYELSVAPDYVQNWRFPEAVRELFQNALDEQTTNPDNRMDFSLDRSSGKLFLHNTNSSLTRNTLLFGCGTKQDDGTTLGKFGEGYKLAMLVLTRLGYPITVFNTPNEIWTPSLVESRKYRSKILVVDIKRKLFADPRYKLTFMVEGVQSSDFDSVSKTVLPVYEREVGAISSMRTRYGDVLLDEAFRGKVFVGGLFVQELKTAKIKYGYNLLPEHVHLDRDRKMIRDFDLFWLTSQLWLNEFNHVTDPEVKKMILDMVKEECLDVQYISSNYELQSLAEDFYKDFQTQHGVGAYPVSNQFDFERVTKTYGGDIRPIVVSANNAEILVKATTFHNLLTTARPIVRKSPKELLVQFRGYYGKTMKAKALRHLNELIEDSENWVRK